MPSWRSQSRSMFLMCEPFSEICVFCESLNARASLLATACRMSCGLSALCVQTCDDATPRTRRDSLERCMLWRHGLGSRFEEAKDIGYMPGGRFDGPPLLGLLRVSARGARRCVSSIWRCVFKRMPAILCMGGHGEGRLWSECLLLLGPRRTGVLQELAESACCEAGLLGFLDSGRQRKQASMPEVDQRPSQGFTLGQGFRLLQVPAHASAVGSCLYWSKCKMARGTKVINEGAVSCSRKTHRTSSSPSTRCFACSWHLIGTTSCLLFLTSSGTTLSDCATDIGSGAP